MSEAVCERILSFRRRVESIDLGLSRLSDTAAQDLYTLLGSATDPAPGSPEPVPCRYFIDPRYLSAERPNLTDWTDRRYTLGYLLLETILRHPVRRGRDLIFRDDDQLDLGLGDPDLESLLNRLLRELLGADPTDLAGPAEIARRLRPVVYHALGMRRLGGLWVSPLVRAGQFRGFLAECPEWTPAKAKADSNYLHNLDRLGDADPLQWVCGASARAFCDWLSRCHGLTPCAAPRPTDAGRTGYPDGFRLPTPAERRALDGSPGFVASANHELIDNDGEGALWSRGSNHPNDDRVTPTAAVFRFLCNGD